MVCKKGSQKLVTEIIGYFFNLYFISSQKRSMNWLTKRNRVMRRTIKEKKGQTETIPVTGATSAIEMGLGIETLWY